MKKGLFLLSLIVTFYALGTVSASAVTNDTVKVGLRYGSSVMWSCTESARSLALSTYS